MAFPKSNSFEHSIERNAYRRQRVFAVSHEERPNMNRTEVRNPLLDADNIKLEITKARKTLVPSGVTARLFRRARGTVSHNNDPAITTSIPANASEQSPSTTSAIPADADSHWIVASPAAAVMERALLAEWADGDKIARSIETRSAHVNRDDALAAYAFFGVTNTFFRAYVNATRNVLKPDVCGKRESALASLDAFEQALARFVAIPEPEQALEAVRQFQHAKRATIAAVRADRKGEPGTSVAGGSEVDVARAIFKADGGPMLVLMLARGAKGSVIQQVRWGRAVACPPGWSPPRMRMCRLRWSFYNVHAAHAAVFASADREYRSFYRSCY